MNFARGPVEVDRDRRSWLHLAVAESQEENRRAYAEAIAKHQAAGDVHLYGTQWGDPRHGTLRYLFDRYVRRRKIPGNLREVVRRYITPHVRPGMTVLEIGAGGGRWTQFLLPAARIIVVETTPEFFPYLEARFGPRFELYQSDGAEISRVGDAEVDYAFSFGTFVHTPPSVLDGYLADLQRILRPGAIAVIQYSDKRKRAARRPGAEDEGFADLDAPRFETMAREHGFLVRTHDTRRLNHSNIAVLVKP